jgi:hypothetical protein
VCMYSKTASFGVESMNRVNEDICQRTAVDILNAALILLKKESSRYDKACNQGWNHAQTLSPKETESMEEAFKKINVQDFKFHLAEDEHHHTAVVSKKSTSEREYSVIIPKTDAMGSRFGKCTCGFLNKEGVPCDHMVAVSKYGRINGLTRVAVVPHWYTTPQCSINFLRILTSTHTKCWKKRYQPAPPLGAVP